MKRKIPLWIFGALGALVVVPILLSSNLFSEGRAADTRGSAAEDRGLDSIAPADGISWEERAQERLSEGAQSLSAVGRAASPVDRFRLGVLSGGYRVQVKDGLVSHVQFRPESKQSPKVVSDPKAFLERYQKLFTKTSSTLKKASEGSVPSNVSTAGALEDRTVVALRSASGLEILRLQVLRDSNGGLLEIRVL